MNTEKNKVFELLKNNKIYVDDEQLLSRLLDNLYEDEIKLIIQVIEKLLSERYKFHIEVYETDGDLEELYFVIHYANHVSRDNIRQDLFRLNEFVRNEISPNILAFVGFASEINKT